MNKRMEMNRRSGLWRSLQLLCLIGLLVTVFAGNRASAQTNEGAIVGVVTDSTGAVIPSADVTLTDIDTGLVLKTKSNASGNYFFRRSRPGTIRSVHPRRTSKPRSSRNIVVHVHGPPEHSPGPQAGQSIGDGYGNIRGADHADANRGNGCRCRFEVPERCAAGQPQLGVHRPGSAGRDAFCGPRRRQRRFLLERPARGAEQLHARRRGRQCHRTATTSRARSTTWRLRRMPSPSSRWRPATTARRSAAATPR